MQALTCLWQLGQIRAVKKIMVEETERVQCVCFKAMKHVALFAGRAN